MKILLLAPQPFYTERGTPIAVRLAATALVRAGHRVDLLCYHAGEDFVLDGLRIHRIAPPAFVRDVPIGFSWRKVACDLALARRADQLLTAGRHEVVHAVEEAVFIALAARRRHRFALVYDMDSLMAAQLAHKWRWLAPWSRQLERFERAAARRADRVLAVCPALASFAAAAGAEGRVHLLPDVAFPLPASVFPQWTREAGDDLRALFPRAAPLLLYVGNLERYQGVDLLLQAMAIARSGTPCHLAVVGGGTPELERLRARARELGVDDHVRFLGPRPLAQLPDLLRQADILCSPRRAGANTPMKIYSYMAAGRAIVATAIEAHTQVLDDSCALLVPPEPKPFGDALRRLAADPDARAALAARAKALACERHGFAAFERRLAAAYRGLEGGSERAAPADGNAPAARRRGATSRKPARPLPP